MTEPVPTKVVHLEWLDGMRFRGGEPDLPPMEIDADLGTASGPMGALLVSAATCTGADIVSILEKMRVRLSRFRMRVEGIRRGTHPKRFTAIAFAYELAGEGLDEAKARRAIELSQEKYCSVMHSLAPDIEVSYVLALGDPAGA